jgi:hypothetical protein
MQGAVRVGSSSVCGGSVLAQALLLFTMGWQRRVALSVGLDTVNKGK